MRQETVRGEARRGWLGLWGLALAVPLVFLGGCSGGIGPDVAVAPQYQPGPQLKAIDGKKTPVAVQVVDLRKERGPVRPDGREVLTEGDKGKVILAEPLANVLQRSLTSALTAAGFTVSADAPVTVELQVVEFPLVAQQFTHWGLPSERASTLDALGAVLPGPVRETTAKAAVNVVIRKHDARLGFSHIVSETAANTSPDKAVVQQTIDQVVSKAVDDVVAQAAPDIEIVTRTPVTSREINDRSAELERQQEIIRRLTDSLAQRDAALAGDRKALEEMRHKIDEERIAAEAAALAQKNTMDAERAKLDQQRKELADREQALATRPADDASAKDERDRVQAMRDDLNQRQQALDKQAADLATAQAALEARRQQLAEREKNVAAYDKRLKEQADSNQALATDLQQRQKDLADREAALQKWKQDVESRADVKPTEAVVGRRKPLILITEPSMTALDTTLPRITVAGIAAADSRLATLRASVNGQPIDLRPATAPPVAHGVGVRSMPQTQPSDTLEGQRFSFDANLKDGANEILVEAADAESQSSVQRLNVQYNRGEGRVFILAIGINAYENRNEVPPLRFAVSDARDMATALDSLLKTSSKHVTQMLDADASRQKLMDELFYRLPSEVTPADTVVIFFSGHGAPDAATDNQGNVETYLLPIDADPARLVATAIKMSDIGTILRRLRSERIVFLADTCYSGAAGNGARSVSMPGVALRAVGIRTVPKRPQGKGCAILTASTGSQVAQERDAFGHGIFSYYVLEGLKGGADANHDGAVTVDELYAYVKDQVSKSTGGSQVPQISRDATAGDIVLSQVGK